MSSRFYILWLLTLLSCSTNKDKQLLVAVAANCQFAMEDIKVKFEEELHIPVELIVGSSGKLTSQIAAGAPYHVLVSADRKYPQQLIEKGFALGPDQPYAYGVLVFWSMDGEFDFKSIPNVAIDRVAIANSQTAPYGQAAMETIKNMGLLADWEDKLIYGESVSQVNQFITTGNAQLGLTSKSTVLSPDWSGTGTWIEVDTGAYSRIEQSAIVIKSDKENERNAQLFLEFLASQEAQSILQKYGYAIPQK